jgi:hypothetical protein
MKNVQMSLRDAIAVCEASQKLFEASRFHFIFHGAVCLFERLDGNEAFSGVPDEMQPQFAKIYEASKQLSQQILELGLDEREIDTFLSEYFKINAMTVRERRLVRDVQSALELVGVRRNMTFTEVLEEQVDKAIVDGAVNVTSDMVDAKISQRTKLAN